MENTEKTVQKQVILRMFLPDMETLKAVAKDASAMKNVKLGLYGQAGEVLVAIAAQTAAPAAAMQLTDAAAQRFEEALGDCCYARGKESSLAKTTTALLDECDCAMACAEAETGRLLEAELKDAKHAKAVFDFGQNSFRNARMSEKLQKAYTLGDKTAPSPMQQAIDRSYAAAKCTRSEFGTAITGLEEGSSAVWAAVTYKGHVYVRAIRPAADAAKGAALSILDMIRLLCIGVTPSYARAFAAGEEANWEKPLKKLSHRGGGNKLLVPVILLVIVSMLLVFSLWYLYQTFFAKVSGNTPAASSVSQSEIAPAASVPASSQAA